MTRYVINGEILAEADKGTANSLYWVKWRKSEIKKSSDSTLIVSFTPGAYREGGGLGVQTPPPEIPKALQNRATLNQIVKNC